MKGILQQVWFLILGSVLVYSVVFAAQWGHHVIAWAKRGDTMVQAMAAGMALVVVVVINRIGKATHERIVG